MNEMQKLNFEEVSKDLLEDQVEFLFNLLKSRRFGISHKSMPTFNEHKFFISNFPYFKWLIISYGGTKIGALYINQDNSVSINLLPNKIKYLDVTIKSFESKFLPQEPLKSLRSKNFFFNLHPEDIMMQKTLEKNGYVLSQISYEKNKK